MTSRDMLSMELHSCVAVLVILLTMAPSLAQDSGYRPASLALQPVLSPQAPQPVGQSPPSLNQSVPAVNPARLPIAAHAIPPEAPRKALSSSGKEILRKFDDYLFKNLEDTYFRLTYAFEDAAKRALEDCGCSVGDSGTSTQTPPPQ